MPVGGRGVAWAKVRPSVDGVGAGRGRRDAGGGVADGPGGHGGGVGGAGEGSGGVDFTMVVVVVDFTSLRPKTSNEINTISIRPRGKSLEPHSYFSHVLSGFFTEFFPFFLCSY